MRSKSGTVIIVVLSFAVLVIYCIAPVYRDESSSNPTLKQVKANFTKLDPKFSDIPLRTGDSAYTENKKAITLCLADPDTNHHYDINTVMYVALHELAHVITPSNEEEHGEAFKKNFSNLLRKATEKGVYNPRIPIPATYCKVGTR